MTRTRNNRRRKAKMEVEGGEEEEKIEAKQTETVCTNDMLMKSYSSM